MPDFLEKSASSPAQWAIFDQRGDLESMPVLRMNDKSVVAFDGGKVPRSRLWMLCGEDPAPLIDDARRLAAGIDIEALWRAAAGDTLDAEELGRRMGCQSPADALAALQAALAHPAYFRRVGGAFGGKLAPADEALVEKVRAGLRRRAEEEEAERAILAQAEAGRIPPEIAARCSEILAGEDKNSVVYRAAKRGAGGEQNIPRWLVEIGACADARECWEKIFDRRWPSRPQAESAFVPPLSPPEAPPAFSVDEAGTFEVDDAFSVRPAGSGFVIGVHIAAPALDDELFSGEYGEYDSKRLTSVYFPDGKHPMLSDVHIGAYSLRPGSPRPALSLYCEFHPGQAPEDAPPPRTELDSVVISANYAPDDFDDGAPAEVAEACRVLADFAETLPPLPPRERADLRITTSPPRVLSAPRRPIGLLVEKMMRHINGTWAQMLPGMRRTAIGGIFRSEGGNAVRPADAHAYAWMSSPLRRYADLANQRMLLAVLGRANPPPVHWRGLARAFSSQQTLARRYQDMMERHWALRALADLPAGAALEGHVQENGRVRLRDYPVAGHALDRTSLPECGGEVRVALRDIDFFEQRVRFTLL